MIGKNLADLRHRLGLTQEELASRIGIRRVTWSHYENNRTEPNIATLIKLSDHFGITIDEIVKGEEVG